jgi:hypothetical protein
MGRAIVDQSGARLCIVTDMIGELMDHRLELVDATALLVHHLVERLDQILGVHEFEFNIDKTFFLTHSIS